MTRDLPRLVVLILLLAAAASESAARDCSVRAGSVVLEAVRQGFRFSATRVSGSGSCTLSSDSRSVTGVAGTSPLICRGEFFTARSFASGWRVEDPEFLGGQFDFDDAGGSIAIVFQVSTGGSGSRTLSTITLVGPDCERWRDAFSHVTQPRAPAEGRADAPSSIAAPPADSDAPTGSPDR